jgi:hypothetical protein
MARKKSTTKRKPKAKVKPRTKKAAKKNKKRIKLKFGRDTIIMGGPGLAAFREMMGF